MFCLTTIYSCSGKTKKKNSVKAQFLTWTRPSTVTWVTVAAAGRRPILCFIPELDIIKVTKTPFIMGAWGRDHLPGCLGAVRIRGKLPSQEGWACSENEAGILKTKCKGKWQWGHSGFWLRTLKWGKNRFKIMVRRTLYTSFVKLNKHVKKIEGNFYRLRISHNRPRVHASQSQYM